MEVTTYVRIIDKDNLAIGMQVYLPDGGIQLWVTDNPEFYVDDPRKVGNQYQEVLDDIDYYERRDHQMLFNALKEKYAMVLDEELPPLHEQS